MAGRYPADFLLHLRESPLCVKPPNLPPPEDWMGPPPETFRNTQKTTNDRPKTGEGALLNQENRRPPHDRNGSRNVANPDELILGPPRTSFASASATSMRTPRTGDVEKGFRDSERQDRTDRFNFRNRTNEPEAPGDRFSRDARDGRNNGLRRRGDQDQDNEGWSTVKPRKSFGHEGAERFQGRMGGVGIGPSDRFGSRDDTRRVRDDREGGDRRNRPFDRHSQDQEGEDPDTPRRNGLARGKLESWFKENAASANTDAPPMSQRERIEKAKSWRDREPQDKSNDRYGDRNDRHFERRWDRDRHARVENDPEWLDEPLEDQAGGHTEEDFKKFMETMKAGRGSGASKAEEKPSMVFDKPTAEVIAAVEQKVVSAPAMEQGPDKFFAAYGSSGLEVGTPITETKDAAKPKAAKSSRFMAFLAPQEDNRARTEPPTPAAGAQHGGPGPSHQSDADKEAFALLIQKLQRSGFGPALQSSAPPTQSTPNRYPELSPFQEMQQKSAVASPEPFQQYGNSDRRDDSRMRNSQHSMHDIISPRPMGLPVPPPQVSRPEQALQDLLAQRHHLPNQGNTRAEQQNVIAVNRNRDFLVGLMQSHRDAPEPPRTEQLLLRMPQPTKQVTLGNMADREQDYPRERSASQRQQMRSQGGPPGFLDESQFHPENIDARPPPQPTQILQRPPPPPGLDHQMHPFHMGGINPAVAQAAAAAAAAAGQMPPPQRPMIPPPGLMNNGPRNMGPMPGMFPPNFPPPHGHGGPGPGNFPPGPPPPSDGMVGPPPGPPRSMQPPPGFFGGPPPPGFMPPPGMGGGGGGYQGPDGPVPGPGGMGGYGGGGLPSPFERLERMGAMDRRGMMPPGAYRGP